MDNPYRSPVETEELPQRPHPALNPSYRIDQLEKRFNRLRWCWAACYIPLAMLTVACSYSLRIFILGFGPVELGLILCLPAIIGLIATRKK